MVLVNQDKINFLNNIREYWFTLCDEDGVNGGFGFYNTFFHLDSRINKPRSTWNFRFEI